jgi:hypothetical protein
MIAANFRKFPEAQLLQLELELSGVVGASEDQRGVFWSWLMSTGKAISLPSLPRPGWWVAAKRRAFDLAKSVCSALPTPVKSDSI